MGAQVQRLNWILVTYLLCFLLRTNSEIIRAVAYNSPNVPLMNPIWHNIDEPFIVHYVALYLLMYVLMYIMTTNSAIKSTLSNCMNFDEIFMHHLKCKPIGWHHHPKDKPIDWQWKQRQQIPQTHAQYACAQPSRLTKAIATATAHNKMSSLFTKKQDNEKQKDRWPCQQNTIALRQHLHKACRSTSDDRDRGGHQHCGHDRDRGR